MKYLSILLFFMIASFSLSAQSTCGLNNFAYEIIEDGDVFYIAIQQPVNIHNNFNVYINGNHIENTQGKIGPYKADCQTFYSLSVYRKGIEACNVTANIGSVCSSTDCYIRDIEVSYPDCNADGAVYVSLDFKYANVSDSFTVRGNGIHYGEFSYNDLPVKLGPFPGDCDTKYEFDVRDSEINSCGSNIGDIIICCQINCGPPAFEIVSMDCSEEKLHMKLELKEGQIGTNIIVKINEENVTDFEVEGKYIYLHTALPLNVVKHTVSVCTVGIADVCCYSQDFSTDECSPGDECKIYAMTYSISDCQPNEEIFLKLDFKYKNQASDSFMVNGNGVNYGEFAYADLPVLIGPFESACDVVYELGVHDSQDENCGSAIEDLIICCDHHCIEPIFEIISMSCDDDLIRLKLELFHPLFFDELFIAVNGDTITDYQLDFPHLYLEIPYTATTVVQELQICSPYNNIEYCCYSQVIDLNDCNPNGECKIGSIHVTPSECSDSAEVPYFKIDFDYAGVGDKGFSVKGNGFDYGDFKYEDLPIKINRQDSCELNYEFVVIDNELGCTAATEYGHVCCTDDCSFRISQTRVKCEDGLITEIAFFLDEVTDPLKEYSVYANGTLIGETDENNVFLEFETQIPLDGVDGLELMVCDDECCVTKRLDISECYEEPGECSISNIELGELTCGGNGLNFILDFDHEGTTSGNFDLFSVFGLYGTFSYSDLPLKIEDYPALNVGLNVVFICDKGTFCCQAKLFSTPACLIFGDDEGNVAAIHSQENVDLRYIRTNPANNELILDSPFKNTTYHLYNSGGQKVKTIKSNILETIVDTSPIAPGMYIVRIENEAGIKIEKLIIAK